MTTTGGSFAAAVASRFDRAAETYDSAADIQRRTAYRVAAAIGALPLRFGASALEIGCGTGNLTDHLIRDPRLAALVVNDIAPSMIRVCRQRVGAISGKRVAFRVGDASRGGAQGIFDLVAGNLVLQWFAEPRAGLRYLAARLAPGGYLVLSSLGPASFASWKRICAEAGIPARTRQFETIDALETEAQDMLEMAFSTETLTVPHADMRGFLSSLRGIGATAPEPGVAAAPFRARRDMVRKFGGRPLEAEYQVVLLVGRRHGAGEK